MDYVPMLHWSIQCPKLKKLFKKAKYEFDQRNFYYQANYIDLDQYKSMSVLYCKSVEPHTDDTPHGYTALLIFKANHELRVKPGKRHLRPTSALRMPLPPHDKVFCTPETIVLFRSDRPHWLIGTEDFLAGFFDCSLETKENIEAQFLSRMER